MPLDFIYEKKAQHLVLDLVICQIPETKIALVDSIETICLNEFRILFLSCKEIVIDFQSDPFFFYKICFQTGTDLQYSLWCSMYNWRAHENVSFVECAENRIHSVARNVKKNSMQLLFSLDVNNFCIDNRTKMANNSMCIQTNYAILCQTHTIVVLLLLSDKTRKLIIWHRFFDLPL